MEFAVSLPVFPLYSLSRQIADLPLVHSPPSARCSPGIHGPAGHVSSINQSGSRQNARGDEGCGDRDATRKRCFKALYML